MKRFILAALPAAVLLLPGSASACGIHPAYALIHSALPNPLPAGTVIADAEIAPDGAGPAPVLHATFARVRRMIQGEAAPMLILRTGRPNSCKHPLANGRTGLIIATPEGRQDGIPVVRAIFVHANDGFRLPDGYQLPPPGPPCEPSDDEVCIVD
ncbi:MAG TPA: hypothetical protein VEC11_14905 [Allosphingosinicella sp.]|nr:hypothetical protein [Allosphingosinicella sp.]